jgi:hypothetical protein
MNSSRFQPENGTKGERKNALFCSATVSLLTIAVIASQINFSRHEVGNVLGGNAIVFFEQQIGDNVYSFSETAGLQVIPVTNQSVETLPESDK